MSGIRAKIEKLLGFAPAELVQMYESGALLSFPDSRINILPFGSALVCSEQMNEIPLAGDLGLWVLDDANDSNPYGLITKGPYQGYVVHFSHDPEPEISFDGLSRFLAEVQCLGESRAEIDNLKKTVDRRIDISDDAIRLAKEDTEDSIWLLCLYLTANPILSIAAQEAIAGCDDFFAGEALAIWLAENGTSADLPVAEKLAADDHPQVSNPGKAAVSKIRARSSQQGNR